METDIGFRHSGEFQDCLTFVRSNDRNQLKNYTKTRAIEVYKCIKLIRCNGPGKQRDLSQFNAQYKKSLVDLASSTGETMPLESTLSRLDSNKNPIYTFTEKTVNDSLELENLLVKGTPVLVEEDYYTASKEVYRQFATGSEGPFFLRLSTNAKIRKIQSFLLKKYYFNAELLFYLDTTKSVPNTNDGPPNTNDDFSNPNQNSAHGGVVNINAMDGNSLMAQLAANATSVTLVNVQSGATNIGVQRNGPTGTPEWAERLLTEQHRQGTVQEEMHRLTTGVKPVPSSANRFKPTSFDPNKNLAGAFESHFSSPQRQTHDILQQLVRTALAEPNLQANLDHYKTHDPDPNDESEVSYFARLSTVQSMLNEMETNSDFVNKQLSGLTQRPMDVDELGSAQAQSWSELTKQLSRALFFFGDNQVLLYNEGAIMQKGKDELVPLVLPIAGFTHPTTVYVHNLHKTQLTVTWFENSAKEAATVVFALIQLALASQRADIANGSETPCLVEVDFSAEGNKPAAIVLPPDQFSQLCNLSDEDAFQEGCDASNYVIEFKKGVFTSPQQAGVPMTAGQIILTDCVLHENGQELSRAFLSTGDDMVLWQLTVRGNFPFGTEQSLDLVEDCKKEIVIGSGAAADLFKQEHLVERLKEEAATSGIFFSWKFDVSSYSPGEMEQLRHFLGDIYKRKLLRLEDRSVFADTKAEIIKQLKDAYDLDDPNGETYDWPCDIVDILPGTQHQVVLASFVRKMIEPLVFVEHQRPAAAILPAPPRPATESIPLASLFANQMIVANDKRKCILCALQIEIDKKSCPYCYCTCMPGKLDTACKSCRESNRINGVTRGDDTAPGKDPGELKDPALEPKEDMTAQGGETAPLQLKLVERGGFSVTSAVSVETKVTTVAGGGCLSFPPTTSAQTKDTTSRDGGGWSLKEGDIAGEPPALVEEKGPFQASESLRVATGFQVEEKKTDEAPQVRASEARKVRKFQKNDAVKINSKVNGPKRDYIGKSGTVLNLKGSWVHVQLEGEESPVAFYPAWLD